jgi:hypothetical protein
MAATTMASSPRRSWKLVAALALGVLLAPLASPAAGVQSTEPKPTAEPTPTGSSTSGVDGNAYTGPTYGHTVTWDDEVWDVEEEVTAAEYDGLQLGTPRSTVYIEGYAGFGGDEAECLADAALEVRDRPGVSEVAPASNRTPPVPADAAGAAVLYIYTQELDDETGVEVVEYIECRTLVEGEAVLEITLQVASRFYSAELPLVRDLLATVALPEATGTAADDELPGRAVPLLDPIHVEPGEPHEPYNSTPPTSGPHWATTAAWGVYDEPVPDEVQVHNLEHGGVILQYSCDCPEAIDILEQFASPAVGYPVLVITAPYPDMEADVALTAWGRILELSAEEVTADVVREFVEAFIDQGPERIHTEELEAWRESDAPKP